MVYGLYHTRTSGTEATSAVGNTELEAVRLQLEEANRRATEEHRAARHDEALRRYRAAAAAKLREQKALALERAEGAPLAEEQVDIWHRHGRHGP